MKSGRRQDRAADQAAPVSQLELDANRIERPTIVEMIEIGAAMLWPDDIAAGARAKERAIVDCSLRLANEGLLDVSLALANMAGAAAPMDQSESRRRFECGAYAGRILYEAIVRSAIGRDAKLGTIMDEIKPGYFGRKATDSKAVYTKIWTPFRRASHFWAAHTFYCSRGHYEWPCARERLPMFLAIADHFRAVAERTKHPSGTVLVAGEAIGLSSDVRTKLPKGKVIFEAIH
jgi:hypothetical protein